ncbi:MAG: hypothetical protein ACE37J_11775 [Pikeienuella sp.]|uniref:hypothetical protein n=1 Tax=Pikeienuella sp. TaxID=2831957 RepID=UPI00391D99D0
MKIETELGDVYPLKKGMRFPNLHWAPVYISQLFESSFWRKVAPEIGFYAMNLWLASLRCDPIGTLPDDKHELRRLALFDGRVDAFERRLPEIMHKWRPIMVTDEDGRKERRLAHPFVTTVALDITEAMTDGAARRLAAEHARAVRSARRQMSGALAPRRMVDDPLMVREFMTRMELHGKGKSDARLARQIVHQMEMEDAQGGLIPLMQGDLGE